MLPPPPTSTLFPYTTLFRSPASARGLVCLSFGGSHAGDLHDRAADNESEGNSCRSSRRAKSTSGKVLLRRREHPHGARIHSAQTREHDRVSGQTFLRSAGLAKQRQHRLNLKCAWPESVKTARRAANPRGICAGGLGHCCSRLRSLIILTGRRSRCSRPI